MKTTLKTLVETLLLFLLGGSTYFLIEILWRGYSHWTMFLLGGLCFICIGLINQFYFTWDMNVFYQMLIGSVMVTGLEFVVGCIVNVWLGWGIWDYSAIPCNVLGQVCIPFALIWYGLSLVAIIVDDVVRWLVFGEDKPHYYISKPCKQKSTQ